MKKIFFKIIASILLFNFFTSCSNNSEDDLIKIEQTTDAVTYNKNIKTIIDNNCVFCHGTVPSNGAPMSLTTYNQVKEAVLNRGLIDRISRPNGDPALMPSGGPRMPQQTIDLVIKWNTDGLIE